MVVLGALMAFAGRGGVNFFVIVGVAFIIIAVLKFVSMLWDGSILDRSSSAPGDNTGGGDGGGAH